jgi:hypothetical protein
MCAIDLPHAAGAQPIHDLVGTDPDVRDAPGRNIQNAFRFLIPAKKRIDSSAQWALRTTLLIKEAGPFFAMQLSSGMK